MRICMDARLARQPGGTGVTTYGAALAETARGLGHVVEPLVEGRVGGRAGVWRGALRPGPWPAPLVDGRRVAGDVFRAAQVRFDLRRTLLPLHAPDAAPTLMHWTYPLPMRWRDVPNLYTVHDLIPLLHPGLSPVPGRRMARLLRRIVADAAQIVTVSEASRQEIVAALGVPPERVTNTYQAVTDPLPESRMVARTLAPLGLVTGGYVLHAGSVERRKNVGRLIAAHRASRTGLPLVIAGPDGWGAAAELAEAGPSVRRIPWLARPALVALLAGARVVVAASLAEGFGLPVAEAMTFGVPVICSDRGALAEVAGDAAWLVDPADTAALAAAIAALSTDDAAAASLVAAGHRRAALFTPAAYASRLRPLYARVAQS